MSSNERAPGRGRREVTTVKTPDTKVCASCGLPRGNRREGWNFHLRNNTAVAVTCPDCPKVGEPIYRLTDPVRFRAVVTGTAPGAAKRKQLTKTVPTLAEAREFVAKVRGEVATVGSYDMPRSLTVRELSERWIKARRAEVGLPGGIREVTLNGYESALHAALLHIGNRQAATVTHDDVQALMWTLAREGGKWKRGLSHRSIVYALGTLRQVFAYGVRQRWITANPAADVKPPRAEHRPTTEARPLRWSPIELAKVRAEADAHGTGEAFAVEPWLRVAVRLTLCGLRRSEVLGMDWSSVDMSTGVVRVEQGRVKTGRGTATTVGGVKAANSLRTVDAETIHPGTRAALRDLWLAQGKPTDGLVIVDAIGRPVDPSAYSRRFVALCESAGVAPLARMHNVRHSLATALDAAGVPEHQAAALLGHDVQTYRRFYLVTDNDGAAAAAKAAGQLFAV